MELYPFTFLVWKKVAKSEFCQFFFPQYHTTSPLTQELFLAKPSVLILKLMNMAALVESFS